MLFYYDFEYHNMSFEVEIEYEYDEPGYFVQDGKQFFVPGVFRLYNVAVIGITGYNSDGDIDYYRIKMNDWVNFADDWAYNYIETYELDWLYSHLLREV